MASERRGGRDAAADFEMGRFERGDILRRLLRDCGVASIGNQRHLHQLWGGDSCFEYHVSLEDRSQEHGGQHQHRDVLLQYLQFVLYFYS